MDRQQRSHETAQLRGETTAELSVSASSYVDPNGFVFFKARHVYRAIYPEREEFYRNLIDSGLARRLQREHGLVQTSISTLKLAVPAIDLVLDHEPVWPVTYCAEWCPSLLKAAAIQHLRIALALVEHDKMLQDAYPWNVLFAGPRPVFIDFTSIVPASSQLIWPAYSQFSSFFTYPLLLCAQGRGNVARALLFDNVNGIRRSDFYNNARVSYKLLRPWLALANLFDDYLQRNPALKRKLRGVIARSRIGVTPEARRAFLHKMLDRICDISFGRRGDVWARYRPQLEAGVNHGAKLAAVRGILEKIRPRTVIDLGCNRGDFSVIAAQLGASVVAVDASEPCAEHLYRRAERESLRITPLIADVLCPTPAFGFLGAQYPPMIERLRSEVALCLGLMHHLHIAGRQSLERIAALLDAASQKHVIFEFVSREDRNNDLIDAPREITYTLDGVKAALSRHFPHISEFESDRSTRKILLCTK